MLEFNPRKTISYHLVFFFFSFVLFFFCFVFVFLFCLFKSTWYKYSRGGNTIAIPECFTPGFFYNIFLDGELWYEYERRETKEGEGWEGEITEILMNWIGLAEDSLPMRLASWVPTWRLTGPLRGKYCPLPLSFLLILSFFCEFVINMFLEWWHSTHPHHHCGVFHSRTDTVSSLAVLIIPTINILSLYP